MHSANRLYMYEGQTYSGTNDLDSLNITRPTITSWNWSRCAREVWQHAGFSLVLVLVQYSSDHFRVSRRWGCAHRSWRVMELRLECCDGIRVDAGFRKRVPLRYCSNENECLYWVVCDLKLWWCLVLGSAGSKMSSACTGMLHLIILKSLKKHG